MICKIALAIATLLVTISLSGPACRADALGEITIDGLTLGNTSIESFMIHCRNRSQASKPEFRRSCRRTTGDAKHGVESFVVTGLPNCDELHCDFVHGQLSRFGVVYFGGRVNALGGIDAIIQTVTKRFRLPEPHIDTQDLLDGTKGIFVDWPSAPPARVAVAGEMLTAQKFRHCNVSLRVTARLARLEIADERMGSNLSRQQNADANLGF